MRGERYLTRDAQFQLVYRKGGSWADRELVIRALPNGLGLTRYGLVISKRVGKAVVRNRIRRRLREMLKKAPLQEGWDIVVIARAPAVAADYKSLENCFRNLLNRAGLLMGEYEGVSPGTN